MCPAIQLNYRSCVSQDLIATSKRFFNRLCLPNKHPQSFIHAIPICVCVCIRDWFQFIWVVFLQQSGQFPRNFSLITFHIPNGLLPVLKTMESLTVLYDLHNGVIGRTLRWLSRFLLPDVHAMYNFFPLGMGEISEYNRMSLLWLGYLIWQRLRVFTDVIKGHHQLTLSKSKQYYPRCVSPNQVCGI